MTPEMYEMWDKHNNALIEVDCELTPEQEAEWIARNATDNMSAIANHSEKNVVVERKKKKKKSSTSANDKKYGILYAEKKSEKKAASKRWKTGKSRNKNARALKKIIPIWAEAREGADERYRNLKYSKIVVEGD